MVVLKGRGRLRWGRFVRKTKKNPKKKREKESRESTENVLLSIVWGENTDVFAQKESSVPFFQFPHSWTGLKKEKKRGKEVGGGDGYLLPSFRKRGEGKTWKDCLVP